ncbi:MAG TPA: PEP-CTERM sorting domain-containing protein, partial [Bryobacteraceae bacterium]
EPSTGFLIARTAMNVAFNDGRGNDLSGIATIEESGTIASEFTIIGNGLLSGAGIFSGTVVKGRNPFKWEYDDPNDPTSGAFVVWSSGPPPPPPRFSTVDIDLPPNIFIDGANTAITFEIDAHATFIPEPSTVLLLSGGLASLIGYAYRRPRKRKTPTYQPAYPKTIKR